jgi:hypothetical protein
MGLVSFEMAAAREELRQAEAALRQTEEVARMASGVAANPTLQDRLRHAERRVEAAKAALQKSIAHRAKVEAKVRDQPLRCCSLRRSAFVAARSMIVRP